MEPVTIFGHHHLPGLAACACGLLPSQAVVGYIGIGQHGSQTAGLPANLLGGHDAQLADVESAGIFEIVVAHFLEFLHATGNSRACNPQLLVFFCRERNAAQEQDG